MNKSVNLDDKKNTVEITLAGETFTISRVVLAVHDMYGEYLDAVNAFYKENQEGLSISERMKRFVAIRKKYTEPMVALLLERNGYEYDEKWWRENIESYEQMDEFIRAAITKDVDADKKKEPEAESLTGTESA